MNDPQKWQAVCFNCKFWQNEKSFQYDCNYNGRWGSCGKFVSKYSRHLTPLALDGGDSASSEQLSTPEVLSTLQGESTPAHRK